METEWQDAQFRSSIKLEGTLLKYEKRLRWGGSMPHGAVGLAVAVVERGQGKPQEGEIVASMDLATAASVDLRKLPYAGYSAYRKPVAIFSGMAAVAAGWSLVPEKVEFRLWHWIPILFVFLSASFCVEYALGAMFPHMMLVIRGPAGTLPIDVHALPVEQREQLRQTIRQACPRI